MQNRITRHDPDAFYSCIIDSTGNIVWKDDADEDWVNDLEYDEFDEPIFKEFIPQPSSIKWEEITKFVQGNYSKYGFSFIHKN